MGDTHTHTPTHTPPPPTHTHIHTHKKTHTIHTFHSDELLEEEALWGNYFDEEEETRDPTEFGPLVVIQDEYKYEARLDDAVLPNIKTVRVCAGGCACLSLSQTSKTY